MLKESYVAKLKILTKDAIKVEVGYPSIFAPSESLLLDFNELRLKLMKKGKTESEARKSAWQQTNFEKRYRKKIITNPNLIDKLKEIKRISKKRFVSLLLLWKISMSPFYSNGYYQ